MAGEKKNKQLDEGIGKMLSLAAAVSLLFLPSTAEANAIKKRLSHNSHGRIIHMPDLQKELKAGSNGSYAGYSEAQASNIIARTIYSEARNQGHEGRMAIMSIIWNRAGGDVSKMPGVCFAKSQFSWWWFSKNAPKPSTSSGQYSPGQYQVIAPSTIMKDGTVIASELEAWKDAAKIAADVVSTGKFESTIGNRNMIGNKKIDTKAAFDSWGKDCDLKVGDHMFGYLPEHDGFKKAASRTASRTASRAARAAKPKIYIVKAGDTLSKIAKKHSISLGSLITKNSINDASKIKAGQKLRI